MSLGPEKIILILVVALIVFGPQRLPDIARQVGAMMRELRRMQDTVRDELENVLHPDFTPPGPGDGAEQSSVEDVDHAALQPGALHAPDMQPNDMQPNGSQANGSQGNGAYANEDVTDDGFAGPRSFS